MEGISKSNMPTFAVDDFQYIPISEFFDGRAEKNRAESTNDNGPKIVFGSLNEFKNVPFANAKLRRIK